MGTCRQTVAGFGGKKTQPSARAARNATSTLRVRRRLHHAAGERGRDAVDELSTGYAAASPIKVEE